MGDPDEYPEQTNELGEVDKALTKVDGSVKPDNFPDDIEDKLKNLTPPKRSLLGEQ